MFCYKCGSEIDDNAKFCRYCGAKMKFFTTEIASSIASQNTHSLPIPKKEKKAKGLIIVVVVLGLVAVALLISFLALHLDSNRGTLDVLTPESKGLSPTMEVNENDSDTDIEVITEIEYEQTTEIQGNGHDESFTNIVLLDQDDIYVEFRGLDEYSAESWIVNLYVENNRDSEIYLSLYDGLINKFSMGFSNNGIQILAGSKYLASPNFDLIIDMGNLAEYGVSCIETLDFTLHISTGLFDDTICEAPVHLDVHKEISTTNREPVESQQWENLLDENGVYVEFHGISEYSPESWIVNLYVENNRDSEIYLILQDGQVNDFSIGFSNNGITIPANSKYLASPNFDLIIDLDNLAAYDITTLQTLNFDISISDGFLGNEIAESSVSLEINKPLP